MRLASGSPLLKPNALLNYPRLIVSLLSGSLHFMMRKSSLEAWIIIKLDLVVEMHTPEDLPLALIDYELIIKGERPDVTTLSIIWVKRKPWCKSDLRVTSRAFSHASKIYNRWRAHSLSYGVQQNERLWESTHNINSKPGFRYFLGKTVMCVDLSVAHVKSFRKKNYLLNFTINRGNHTAH